MNICSTYKSNCHVISHWEEGDKITTRIWIDSIKPSKKWPLRENVGHRGRDEDQQMFVPSNRTWVESSSPKKSADQEGGREKPNDWLGPQNGSGDLFLSAEINSKKD